MRVLLAIAAASLLGSTSCQSSSPPPPEADHAQAQSTPAPPWVEDRSRKLALNHRLNEDLARQDLGERLDQLLRAFASGALEDIASDKTKASEATWHLIAQVDALAAHADHELQSLNKQIEQNLKSSEALQRERTNAIKRSSGRRNSMWTKLAENKAQALNGRHAARIALRIDADLCRRFTRIAERSLEDCLKWQSSGASTEADLRTAIRAITKNLVECTEHALSNDPDLKLLARGSSGREAE